MGVGHANNAPGPVYFPAHILHSCPLVMHPQHTPSIHTLNTHTLIQRRHTQHMYTHSSHRRLQVTQNTGIHLNHNRARMIRKHAVNKSLLPLV